MLDIISRVIKHPSDYKGLLHSNKITFIERIDEENDTYSFIFEIPKNIQWEAGQHGVFTMPGKKVQGRKWRAFSIASAHQEGVIRIATHISEDPSDFKSKLLALTPGDTVTMRGPFGEFHLGKTKHAVGVAGGIGITPLRSIACEIANDIKTGVTLDLIYAGKDGSFAFEDDCKNFANHPNLNIIYVNSPDEVNKALDDKVAEYRNEATYYVSGSPGMVGAIKSSLSKQGVINIISDPFGGY